MSKILTVFGATGNQGGSVARAVLSHPQLSQEYRIRAITRDVTKPVAKALVEQGIEVVEVRILTNRQPFLVTNTMMVIKADLNDKRSVFNAVSGSYAVFGVTNCETLCAILLFNANVLVVWETADFDKDVAQGKNIADASIEAGVQHLIWSSLPNVTKSNSFPDLC
jgi:nucleoside-diphosphate-sugar epimerase